jgi:hypothetical protein
MRSTVRCETLRVAARRRLLQRAASGGFSCSVLASTASSTRASLIERGAPNRGLSVQSVHAVREETCAPFADRLRRDLQSFRRTPDLNNLRRN